MGEESVERGNWGSQLDFLLSCVGFAVGLGNVWRFPYLAYRNGGATFLFPYILMLFIAGLPLFFLELALGQFASEGPITVWKMSPFFSGIGFAMCIISGVVSIYYNVIITYAIYYMFVSFVNLDDDLPWAKCHKDTWATAKCRDTPYPRFAELNETQAMDAITNDVYENSCIHDKMLDDNFTMKLNETFHGVGSYDELNSTIIRNDLFEDCAKTFVSPASEFLNNYVLGVNEATDFSDLGGISLKIILTLALAWLLIFFCLMKGVKSSGKVYK
ncbi:sodium- and chloride-dependent glycine transporter 2-like [Littorina saxatilis]|uniref:sodium- and chloride-dependent glycine transporter 2-like n=1 Tax=Littorina saxatilis TaxID=31220 RepID=UPI0038B534E0